MEEGKHKRKGPFSPLILPKNGFLNRYIKGLVTISYMFTVYSPLEPSGQLVNPKLWVVKQRNDRLFYIK